MVYHKIHYQNITKGIGFLFIVLFVYTATSKLLDIEQFQLQLLRFPYISKYAYWIAWGVPIVELVIAGLYLIPKLILTALYASLLLMSAFLAYIILVLNFSDYFPCSCGGIMSTMGWKDHIIFNAVFIALALLGILIEVKYKNKFNIKTLRSSGEG